MLEPIRKPIRRAIAPVRALFVSDASAGILLILVAAAAMVVANSPLAEDYEQLFMAICGRKTPSISILCTSGSTMA